jgi:hypothetical protein
MSYQVTNENVVIFNRGGNNVGTGHSIDAPHLQRRILGGVHLPRPHLCKAE